MAAELDHRFGCKTTLVRGGGGIFDVIVDGQLVFSKHATGRFPEHSEVITAIHALHRN